MTERLLDNGWRVTEINKHETDFLYNEIVIESTYAKPEFKLDPNGVILDIGANIGLFALYMHETIPNAKIICFEPSPDCASAVRKNTSFTAGKIEVLELAAGNEASTCEFYHYPGYSIMSSLMADPTEDQATLMNGAKLQANKRGINMSERELELLAETILGKRKTYLCKMRRISDVMREKNIERVSLLKIDVEKAEHIVLEGIDHQDLKRIDNIIVEVHDLGNNEQDKVKTLLQKADFNVKMVAEGHLEQSKIYTVWGWRA